MRRRIDSKNDRGMTLVELAIAVLILSIGTVAALRAVDQSRLAIGGAQDRALAQLVARNRVAELQLLGGSSGSTLPSTIEMAGRTFTLSTETKTTAAGLTEATVTARADRGGGAIYVVYLPRALLQ